MLKINTAEDKLFIDGTLPEIRSGEKLKFEWCGSKFEGEVVLSNIHRKSDGRIMIEFFDNTLKFIKDDFLSLILVSYTVSI